MQIKNINDDEELQCHVNMAIVEMITKTKQMFC